MTSHIGRTLENTDVSVHYSIINSICDDILICPICLGTIDNALLLDVRIPCQYIVKLINVILNCSTISTTFYSVV